MARKQGKGVILALVETEETRGAANARLITPLVAKYAEVKDIDELPREGHGDLAMVIANMISDLLDLAKVNDHDVDQIMSKAMDDHLDWHDEKVTVTKTIWE
jgi:hypothetical protein